MFRLLSLILLLAGAGIAALGGWLYMGNELPADLLGRSKVVLERTVLEPISAPNASEPSEASEDAPAPPPPPPEPVAEDTPAEPEAPKPQKPNNNKSRSLSVGAPQTIEPEPPTIGAAVNVLPGGPITEALTADEPTFASESAPIPAAPPPPTIEEQLYSVPIAYETPVSAAFNQAFTVTLAINAQEGAETATGGLSGSSSTNIEEAMVQVTDQVKVNLFGDAFAITTQSPEIQKLSKSTESRWRWDVTPTKTGPQELTFEIFAIHPDKASELVRTFDDTVTVEVSRIGQAMFLAQQYNPIIVIFAGIGSLLAGLFGVLRFFRGS